MSTAEQGGATADTNTPSYGGGGAGGKLRRKPLRRQTTPYDRPSTAVRVNNTNSDNSSSWLKKLVVDNASKIISYGAERLLPSVFRRRLLPPSPPQPPQPPETEIAQESDGHQGEGLNVSHQGEGLNSQGGEQEPKIGPCSQPINSSSSSGVAELEHLLKQKTFTRSEIAHLTELLQLQAVEVSSGGASQKNVMPALDTDRQKEFASWETRNEGVRSSAVMFTPIHNSTVLESDIASPAELAKAYMGSRPSQVSPSALGMRNQLGKEGTGLLANTLIASRSPIMSLAKKTSAGLGAAENGFITPRSRGRSAIYNMARTPYSRVYPNSKLKGIGLKDSGYAGPSTSLTPVENVENFDSRLVTLKRRSSVLDDDMGSVGPMRRIRQKSNLLTPRLHHTSYGVGIGSHAKPKSQLNGEEKDKVLKNSGENDNESFPSTSYAHVPSKSREVAAKILQQLEKFSPREKSSDSKIAAVQEKSPSKSTPSRTPGQAIQSMENLGSSKFLLNAPDNYKSGNKINGTVLDVHGSSPQKQGKAEQNDPHLSNFPSGKWSPLLNNDSVVSSKSSAPVIGDSLVKNGVSQPPKRRSFRISAEEDSLEQDDVECNGIPHGSLSENKGPVMSAHTKPDEEFKATNKSVLGAVLRREREHIHGASVPASEGPVNPIFGSGTPVFDKPKETNISHLFGLRSKPADKSLSSESIRNAESALERPSSSPNMSISIGSEVRTNESDRGFHLKPVKPVDSNGKCDDASSVALNGPLVSSCSPVSFPAGSFSDMSRTSTGSAPFFTSSTSATNFVSTESSTSTAAPSSGTIFGLPVKSSSFVGHDSKPVFSEDLSTSVSAAPAASFSERADQRALSDINSSSGSSTSLYAASSGNGIFKFGGLSNPTEISHQGSVFASAAKAQVSDVGNSQGTTVVSASSASVPALTTNSSASLGSLSSPSFSFGYSSTSSSDTNSLVPAGGPTSSLFKFGGTPSAVSEGSAVSSSTNATPSTFKFGFSSSPSTNAVDLSSGPATPVFGFGGASVSTSAINTASSLTSSTPGVFSFGGSSSASSSTSNLFSSSSSPSNVFGSGWQSSKPPIFGSASTSTSPSTGFSVSASTNAEAPMAFNSSVGASSAPIFSFTSASASAFSSPSLPNTQPIFGNLPTGGGFVASPGNMDQMNAEDSMAEDPVPSPVSNSVFGQPSVPFGSALPPQNNPFMFNGQQNPQNPSPFQASSSLEFNTGGSFSLGSGGGGKAGRKIVKVSRSKNRKK